MVNTEGFCPKISNETKMPLQSLLFLLALEVIEGAKRQTKKNTSNLERKIFKKKSVL